MYQIKNLIATSLITKEWIELDKDECKLYSLSSIMDNYDIVCINLFEPNSINNEYIMLNEHIDLLGDNLEISIDDFFVNNGNLALPTTKGNKSIVKNFVKYNDLFKAGYKIKTTHRTIHNTQAILEEDKTDIILTKEGIDYNDFYNNCLVSINGYFHRTEIDASLGVFVLNGLKTKRHAKCNVIGIHSFKGFGGIRTKTITEEMIKKVPGKKYLKEGFIINLKEDVTHKTVILFIGGYQYLIDNNCFSYFNDRAVMVDISKLYLIEKYHESIAYINLDTLPINRTPRSPSQIGIEDFMSDGNLLSYFTNIEHSFIAIIDKERVVEDRIALKHNNMPMSYVSYIKPEYPIFNGLGKVVNYLSQYEDKQWSIHCVDNYQHNRTYNTTNPLNELSINDNRLAQRPIEISNAYHQILSVTEFITT